MTTGATGRKGVAVTTAGTSACEEAGAPPGTARHGTLTLRKKRAAAALRKLATPTLEAEQMAQTLFAPARRGDDATPAAGAGVAMDRVEQAGALHAQRQQLFGLQARYSAGPPEGSCGGLSQAVGAEGRLRQWRDSGSGSAWQRVGLVPGDCLVVGDDGALIAPLRGLTAAAPEHTRVLLQSTVGAFGGATTRNDRADVVGPQVLQALQGAADLKGMFAAGPWGHDDRAPVRTIASMDNVHPLPSRALGRFCALKWEDHSRATLRDATQQIQQRQQARLKRLARLRARRWESQLAELAARLDGMVRRLVADCGRIDPALAPALLSGFEPGMRPSLLADALDLLRGALAGLPKARGQDLLRRIRAAASLLHQSMARA